MSAAVEHASFSPNVIGLKGNSVTQAIHPSGAARVELPSSFSVLRFGVGFRGLPPRAFVLSCYLFQTEVLSREVKPKPRRLLDRLFWG